MTRHIVVAVVMLIAAFAPLAALAADMDGKVQAVDTAERTLTLENGTKVWLADSVAIDSIKEGSEVTVSYEERDGKPVASSVTPK
jgi:ferritin-like metal-binding protein YciE